MKTLVQTVEIDAPRGVVWRVLTTRDLVREWAAAFEDDMDIRVAWREGGSVEWRSAAGVPLQRGVVGAFEPERMLRFDYPLDPDSLSPARSGAFFDSFELTGDGRHVRLTYSTGPLSAEHYAELERPHRGAALAIKALAEEAAEIDRSSRQPSPKA